MIHESPMTEGQDVLYLLLCGQKQQRQVCGGQPHLRGHVLHPRPQNPSIIQGGRPGP